MYVPDYVINAGGLMNVANELKGYNKEKAKYQVEGIYYILMKILITLPVIIYQPLKQLIF